LKKQKVLITGGGGMLASYLSPLFSKSELIVTDKNSMDITKKDKVEDIIKQIKPAVIFHLAAATNVDLCQKDSKYANEVNFKGTENITKAANQAGSKLVYISSSAIFDGKKRFYFENDLPGPINKYGKSKLLGEKAVKKNSEKYFIVRAGWMIGGGKKEKKFLSHMYKQIKEGKKEISAVSDLFGSITYAKELAEFLRELIADSNYGTYHFSSIGTVSRHELASSFINLLGEKTKINPVSSKTFSSVFFAPRPKYEVVRSKKIKYDRNWQDSLESYVENEFKKKKRKN
jgi:dTDP-4-dehydrorhamnose reductase